LQQGQRTLVLAGTGDEIRDWTDVRDVVRFLVKIGELPQQERFRAINGGSGRGSSVAEIASMLVKHWGSHVAVRYSGVLRAGDPFSLLADNAGPRHLRFDWRITIDRGLMDYVKWFKDQVGD
jgi:UDP-glucose 4-epimerase